MAYKDPEAQKRYRAEWHAKNYKGEYARQHRLEVKIRRQELKDFLNKLKASKGCSRCSENDPRCLDFHHSRGEKERELSRAVLQGWSKEKLQEEADKCDVLCANCHRKHHAGIAKR